MQTTVIFPKHPLLRSYIQYFLFIKNEDPEYSKIHICYPNTNHCLGLHKGNRLSALSGHQFRIMPSPNDHSYLTGIYRTPIAIQSSGVFDEVCIEFEPMGLEMLTGLPFSNVRFLTEPAQQLPPAQQDGLFRAAFNEKKPAQRAAQLEHFFLRHLSDSSFSFIPFNHLAGQNMEELQNQLNLSYRSTHRLYKEKLGIPPKEFLNIQRYRKGVRQLRQTRTLTDLAYQVGFADQSHMIREFKKYTGFTPRHFLENSMTIDNEVWMFVR